MPKEDSYVDVYVEVEVCPEEEDVQPKKRID